MLNNLVIATFILAVGQPSGGLPLKPITDPDAYSIYATLLPSVWKLSGELIADWWMLNAAQSDGLHGTHGTTLARVSG